MITPDGHSKRVVRFGVFEADLDARELRKHGLRVKLQDQPFRVLALLLERPGEIITREELQKAVWPEDTFVEFDHSISTAVQKIRAVLNDDVSSPRFIETVPRRGYRFIAPVQSGPDDGTEHGSNNHTDRPPKAEFPMCELVAVIVLLLAGWYFVIPQEPTTPSANRPAITFSIRPPDGYRFLPVYWGGGIVPSPDGRNLVFVVQGPDGVSRLALRELQTTQTKVLARTEGAIFPFWSPDSRSIGFWAEQRLSTLRLDRGTVHQVAKVPRFRGAAWSSAAGGVIVYSPGVDQPLSRVSASGGSPEPVTTLRPGELSHRWPRLLPDQRRFLYFVQRSRDARNIVRAGSIDPDHAAAVGREPWLQSDSTAQFLPDGNGHLGWLLFVNEGDLTARRFDAEKLEPLGRAVSLANGIEPGVPRSGNYNFDASTAGILAYRSRPGSFGMNQLVWFDRQGKRLEAVGEPSLHNYVGLSPDGAKVAVTATERIDHRTNVDIWVYDLSRSVSLRRTYDPDLDRTPVWSPDSRTILFCSNRESRSRMYRITAMGSEKPQPFFNYGEDEPARDWPSDWSAIHDLVIFGRHNGVDFDIWAVQSSDPSSAAAVVDDRENQFNAKLSPDGRALAYASGPAKVLGDLDIYLQPYPPTGEKFRVSTAGGNQPLWRGDGRELYYLTPRGALMAISVRMGPPIELSAPRQLFQTEASFSPARAVYQYAVSGDGQRFLVAAEIDSQPATVVVNWRGLLRE